MFGPLNGVRTALVIAAAVAAVMAAILGEWLVAGVLTAAIGFHGLGWWYLYRQHQRDQSDHTTHPDRISTP